MGGEGQGIPQGDPRPPEPRNAHPHQLLLPPHASAHDTTQLADGQQQLFTVNYPRLFLTAKLLWVLVCDWTVFAYIQGLLRVAVAVFIRTQCCSDTPDSILYSVCTSQCWGEKMSGRVRQGGVGQGRTGLT